MRCGIRLRLSSRFPGALSTVFQRRRLNIGFVSEIVYMATPVIGGIIEKRVRLNQTVDSLWANDRSS